MKIVVLASLAASLVNFRGKLLAAMVAAGHEVVACAPDEDAATAAALAALGVRYRRIAMQRTDRNPFGDLRTLWTLVALLRRERPDTVLAYTQKPIIYGGLAARLVGVPFHAMVSGLGYVFSGGGRGRALLRSLVVTLYRAGVGRARTVFVFNADDRAEMLRWRIIRPDHNVVQVAGSGVDTGRFVPAPVPDGAPVFLLIARLLRDKGLAEFAEAARRLRASYPDARFQLLGPLDPNPTGVTMAQLAEWNAAGGVEYLGETRDVAPFLARASVFVLPTFYREGLPRTILEALASGRAVITTDAPGCRETVEPGRNGFLVPVRDAGALAAAMREFLLDPGLAARMGRRSREIAEARFDVDGVNAVLMRSMALDVPRHDQHATRPSARLHWRPVMQRGLNILVALAGLVLAAPLLVSGALATWLSIGRPVLFVQQRSGRGGAVFPMIKLRTMTNARDPAGRLLPDRSRVTRTGRFLRRSRIDELPGLWHLLIGDMALIGPRPLLPTTIAAMGTDGVRRGTILPGLTGWAQVNGNALLDDRQKLALDLWYIDHRSLRLDIAILARTIRVVVLGERIDQRKLERAYAGRSCRER